MHSGGDVPGLATASASSTASSELLMLLRKPFRSHRLNQAPASARWMRGRVQVRPYDAGVKYRDDLLETGNNVMEI